MCKRVDQRECECEYKLKTPNAHILRTCKTCKLNYLCLSVAVAKSHFHVLSSQQQSEIGLSISYTYDIFLLILHQLIELVFVYYLVCASDFFSRQANRKPEFRSSTRNFVAVFPFIRLNVLMSVFVSHRISNAYF